MLPAMDVKYQKYGMLNFDDADISLLEYSELPDYVIVTEDKPMLALNISSKNNIIQLADFFLICLEEELIDTGQFRQYRKWLRSKKNITKNKYNRLQP